MNHRYGYRWQTDLKIRVTCGEEPRLFPARLLNLSFNGAAVSLSGLILKPGMMIKVQLPGVSVSSPALVVHTQDSLAGLLWIEHTAGVKKLLDEIAMNREDAQAYADAASG